MRDYWHDGIVLRIRPKNPPEGDYPNGLLFGDALLFLQLLEKRLPPKKEKGYHHGLVYTRDGAFCVELWEPDGIRWQVQLTSEDLRGVSVEELVENLARRVEEGMGWPKTK